MPCFQCVRYGVVCYLIYFYTKDALTVFVRNMVNIKHNLDKTPVSGEYSNIIYTVYQYVFNMNGTEIITYKMTILKINNNFSCEI